MITAKPIQHNQTTSAFLPSSQRKLNPKLPTKNKTNVQLDRYVLPNKYSLYEGWVKWYPLDQPSVIPSCTIQQHVMLAFCSLAKVQWPCEVEGMPDYQCHNIIYLRHIIYYIWTTLFHLHAWCWNRNQSTFNQVGKFYPWYPVDGMSVKAFTTCSSILFCHESGTTFQHQKPVLLTRPNQNRLPFFAIDLFNLTCFFFNLSYQSIDGVLINDREIKGGTNLVRFVHRIDL